MTTDTVTSESVPENKPRKPWLAALMSLVSTGLGQVYNGQWRKGVAFFMVEWLATLVMILFWKDFAAMLLSVAILTGFNLFVAGEAFASARALKRYTPGAMNRWWIYALILVVNLGMGIAFESLIKESFFKTYKAPSGSMIPTLMIGDHFMAEMLGPDEPLKRGEIVIFPSPQDPAVAYVKRVIGLPGESVQIKDKAVYINGSLLDEPYVRHMDDATMPVRDNLGPYTLKDGEILVLGDNRENSLDSRWFGPVRREKIQARARYIYFPGNIGDEHWAERFGMELR